MAGFKSRKDAEEVLLNCIYEIKDILNKDLSLTKLRKRTIKEWFSKFGESVSHLNTRKKLQRLESLKLDAESFILFNPGRNLLTGDPSLEETWVQ